MSVSGTTLGKFSVRKSSDGGRKKYVVLCPQDDMVSVLRRYCVFDEKSAKIAAVYSCIYVDAMNKFLKINRRGYGNFEI